MLNRISILLYRGFKHLDQRAKRVSALTLVLILFCAFFTTKMRFILSTDDLIDTGIQSSSNLTHLKEVFPEGPSTLLTLIPDSSRSTLNPVEICEINTWLAKERFKNTDLIDVQSPFDLRKKLPQKQEPRFMFPPILDLRCESPVSSAAELQSQWEEIRQSPWGFMLTDREARDFSIQFTFRETPGLKFGNFDPDMVRRLRQSTEEKLLPQLPQVKAQWIGTADFQYYTHEGMKFASRLNLIMLLVLMITLRLTYGTWSAGFIYNGVLIMSAVIVYGLKGFFNSPFDILSNSIFLMLGIATLEDFVFVSGEQLFRGMHWKHSLRRILLPGFYTSLTTVIGFASLAMSDLEVIRRLGIWSAVGALIEWFLLFMILPPILSLFFKRTTWVNPEKAHFSNLIKRLTGKKVSVPWAKISLLVYPVMIWACAHLNINDSTHLLFPSHHPIRTSMEHLSTTHDWKGSVSLLFSSALAREEKDEKIEALLQSETGRALISKTESLSQVANYLSREQDEGVQRLIEASLPEAQAGKRLISKKDEERVILYLRETDVSSLMRLKSTVDGLCPNQSCSIAGSLMSYAEFAQKIPETLLESMIVSVILVSLVIAWIAWVTRKRNEIIPLLLASFWGPALMLAFIGLFQLKVSFLTCIFASVLVGLTGDNAIQFLFASKHRDLSYGVNRRGSSSMLTGVVMTLASLVFLGSYFDPPKRLGALLAGGLLAALFGDFWLFKGLRAAFKTSEQTASKS